MTIKVSPEEIWQEHEHDKEYKNKMGFSHKWPEIIRFIEGNQWPPITKNTRHLPRPVINQCDFIIENKQSNILSQTLKMVYSPEEIPKDKKELARLMQASEDYTDAAENTWNDIDQEELNEEAVNDILAIGTGIYHYYWDNSITGGQYTKYVGKVQGETIDPMDIIFGNPQLKPSQVQKQPFIAIRKRKDTEEVKERAKENGENWQLIQPDGENNKDEKYDNGKHDVKTSNQTTTITKYYKKDGQIYWTEVTENAVVQKPRPLTPDTSQKKFKLYPIEPVVFKRRKKSIFGRGIIEDIIPNQKALNWGLAMMLYSVQQTAWPKILAKVGSLMQTLTNEPGEIVQDHFSSPGIDGIKYMQPPNFSTMPILLSDKLLEMTRQVTGTTEVSSGEVIGANMAASAIIALQNQARKPNEHYQKVLFRSIKNIGRIWEEFYKCYYNMPMPITATDKEGKEHTKSFIGAEYADVQFGLKVDVGPTSMFDESLQVTMLDNMADKQWIDKYQYVKYAPSNLIPAALRQDFEKEAEQMAEQQQLMGQADQIMQQLSPEEMAELQANPALLDEIMGGGQIGM